MVKIIRLSLGLVTKVDDEDYDHLIQWNWTALFSKTDYYARRSYRKGGKITAMLMHRYLLKAPVGRYVDHLDNDTLNNQKLNLIIRPVGQARQTDPHPMYGLTWFEFTQKWVVRLSLDGKRHYGGSYKIVTDAQEARDELRKKLGI